MSGSSAACLVRRALRIAPLMTSGVAVVGAGVVLMVPPAATPLVSALSTQTRDVAPVADTGGIIGQFIGFFIGNGTRANPNAGLLIGNVYSY